MKSNLPLKLDQIQLLQFKEYPFWRYQTFYLMKALKHLQIKQQFELFINLDINHEGKYFQKYAPNNYGIYDNQENKIKNTFGFRQQQQDRTEITSQDLFAQIENELEQKQKMLIADDFSNKNLNQTGQLQQTFAQQMLTNNQQISPNQKNGATLIKDQTSNLRYFEQRDGLQSKDQMLLNKNDHYLQNQFIYGNQKIQQNNKEKVYSNSHVQFHATNKGSTKQSLGIQERNKTLDYENISDRENQQNQFKDQENTIQANQANQNEFYEEQQKKLYFQSVNSQQETLKNMLKQIQDKESPQKISIKQKFENDYYQQEQSIKNNIIQNHRMGQQNYNQHEYQNQNYNSQVQSQQSLNSFLTNQGDQYESSQSPSYQKNSFGFYDTNTQNKNQLADQKIRQQKIDSIEDVKILNQNFFQHQQSVLSLLNTLEQFQIEQIKEILNQKNKRQKVVDSSEDIQTIDEQSRESSLDVTNRSSLVNISQNESNVKVNKYSLNYIKTYQLQLLKKEKQEKTSVSGKVISSNKQKAKKQNKKEKSSQVNKKSDQKKESQEKNKMQLQYERALDQKFNGYKKKKQSKTQEEFTILTQNDHLTNDVQDTMSPKHVFLKLSPKTKSNNVKSFENNVKPFENNVKPFENNSNNYLQNNNNAFSSSQSSTYNNSSSTLCQKDELANFKKQVSNLISKENEIKSFFTNSNFATPTNISNEVNDLYQTRYFKIKVQNVDDNLTQQVNGPQKLNNSDQDYIVSSQQSLSERMPSTNKLGFQQEKQNYEKQNDQKQDNNIFDRLMKQNIQVEQMKRSSSVKQVKINTNAVENQPKNQNNILKDQQKNSKKQNSILSLPKKTCIKQNSQLQNQQIKNDNNQLQQLEYFDKPLQISDLSDKNSPKKFKLELDKSNTVNVMSPSSYSNHLLQMNQIQLVKQSLANLSNNSNQAGQNSKNQSIYSNNSNTVSMISLRQQIENKILGSKDQVSTPTLTSMSTGFHEASEKVNQNSKKINVLNNKISNSDKPKSGTNEELNQQEKINGEVQTVSRGRFPPPLPPSKINQIQQQQKLQMSQLQRQSQEKRTNSLPKASYDSLVQSAIMRQQIFKNPEQPNGSFDDKNQENSNNQIKTPITSQRENISLNNGTQNNLTQSNYLNLKSQDQTIGSNNSIDYKKRTESLNVRNQSDQKTNEQIQKNKQGLIRQSSEKIIKQNNNYSQPSNNLFYKPSIINSGSQQINTSHNSDNQYNLLRVNNSYVNVKSNSHLDNPQQENQGQSLMEMDIIERNKLWLTQRKMKNEQKKLEQEKKEVEGCTFQPKLRSKSPHSNIDKSETRSLASYSQYGGGSNQTQSLSNVQMQRQINDLYSSYFDKSNTQKSLSGRNVEGYFQQHQLNLFRKSSLNSEGSQKAKQIQNFFQNQH